MKLIPVVEVLKIKLAEHLTVLSEIENDPTLAKNPDVSERLFKIDQEILDVVERYKNGEEFNLPEEYLKAGVHQWDGKDQKVDTKIFKIEKKDENVVITDKENDFYTSLNASEINSEILGQADVAYYSGAIIEGNLELFDLANIDRGDEW